MPLSLHLSIHVLLSLLAGFLVWKIWQKPFLSFASAFLGGVLVDLDHFIDYFLAFGWHWRLDYFTSGYQFMKNDKIYILFHGWEYAIILLIAAWAFKSKTIKTITLGLVLGLFFHLCADVMIDGLPVSSYSIIYRAENGFQLEKMDPKNIEKNIKDREVLKFNP